jgi:hypothetical protein
VAGTHMIGSVLENQTLPRVLYSYEEASGFRPDPRTGSEKETLPRA